MAKVLKTILIVGVFLVCGLMLARVAIASWWPSEVKNVTETDALRVAAEAGSASVTGFTQDPITPYDNREKGHFFFNDFVAFPTAGEVQLALRYNDSTLRDIAADFGLDEVPAGNDARFAFVLRDDKGTVYPVSALTDCHRFLYTFRRVIFDNVALDGVSYLYLDVYFGDADYATESPYGSMLIYAAEASTKPVTVTVAAD